MKLKKLLIEIRDNIREDTSTKKLIKRGLKVGYGFDRQTGCIIDSSHCWLISIGDNVTLAPRVHILAHDTSTKRHLGYTKIGRVTIGNKVFIGAGSMILPNVKIGDNVIIGAGSVVSRDIPSNTVAVGNPATIISSIEEYINKNKAKLESRPVYDSSYALYGNVTKDKKEQMKKDLENGIGFVK